MKFAVIWSGVSGGGYLELRDWDRAQTMARTIKARRPGDSVRVELATLYSAEVKDGGLGDAA